MAVYGYIRVSTREQNEDRQRIALAEFHVPCETIYMDKLSGKDFNRPQYQKLQRRLRRGEIRKAAEAASRKLPAGGVQEGPEG
ncbi:MAG TPA: recombinase family protein [Candidatus Caccousia avistercoris]|nr:recombinase family protein [Candidatus Caccousia avistercoris]